jgi:hypothetical protein
LFIFVGSIIPQIGACGEPIGKARFAGAQAVRTFAKRLDCRDDQCGWDTDQFPNNISHTAMAMHTIMKGGGVYHRWRDV